MNQNQSVPPCSSHIAINCSAPPYEQVVPNQVHQTNQVPTSVHLQQSAPPYDTVPPYSQTTAYPQYQPSQTHLQIPPGYPCQHFNNLQQPNPGPPIVTHSYCSNQDLTGSQKGPSQIKCVLIFLLVLIFFLIFARNIRRMF